MYTKALIAFDKFLILISIKVFNVFNLYQKYI